MYAPLTILLLLLAALPAAGREDALLEMSLEELLAVQLDQMAVTGIHHTHDAGEWMIGTSHMVMAMDGNQSGTSSLGRAEVFARGFMVSPTSMDMRMHMFHFMAAPTDVVTLMLMMPYVTKSMDHQVNPAAPVPFAGTDFTTKSRGPGDLETKALVRLLRSERHRLILEAGVSFPTGSIDEEDVLPSSNGLDVRLPYPMQLGSGTYDLIPGLTYIGQARDWQWGARAAGTIRLGRNSHDYRLGNDMNATLWGARALTPWLSTSLRLEGQGWGDVIGADDALNAAMVPTADPNLRGGERLDLLLGLNVSGSDGWLAGHRLTVSGGLPLYQSLDGPQLSTAWQLTASWEWTFDSPFRSAR